MKAKKFSKSELKNLQSSLLSVCMIYSDFKNEKRRESFGQGLYNHLNEKLTNGSEKYASLSDNYIVYKGAQWGGKWGNFYKAIYFRGGEFHYGSGFTDKQILSL